VISELPVALRGTAAKGLVRVEMCRRGRFQFGLLFGRACNDLIARLIRNHTRRPSLSLRSSFLA
jgi:hypothetical protein